MKTIWVKVSCFNVYFFEKGCAKESEGDQTGGMKEQKYGEEKGIHLVDNGS